MNQRIWRVGVSAPSIFLFATEAFIICLSVLLAIYLRFPYEDNQVSELLPKGIVIVVFLSMALYYVEGYTTYLYLKTNRIGLLKVILQAITLGYMGLCATYYAFRFLYIGREILLINLIIVTYTLYIWRTFFPWVSKYAGLHRQAIVLGKGHIAEDIMRILLTRKNTGFEVIRRIPVASSSSVDSIKELLEKEPSIKTLIVSDDSLKNLPLEFLWKLQLHGYQLIDGISFHEWLTDRVAEENLTSKNFLFFYNPSNSFFYRFIKRLMDICISLLLIVATLPIQVLIVILVKITSRGPVLYKQVRTGFSDVPFTIYKFRTMIADAEKHSGPKWAEDRDPRITPIGRFLRLSRLDEIPQVFNVLKGEMSVIGPRPERPAFTESFKKEIPFYHLRHAVRPGITGWAQVTYEYTNTVEATAKKLQYDLYYIKNFSLALDLIIILKTLKTLVTGKGAR